MSGYVPGMDLTPSHSSPDEGEPSRAGAPDGSTDPQADPRPGPGVEAGPDPALVELGTGGTASRSTREIGGKKFRVGTGDEYVPFRSRTKRRRRMIAAAAVVLLLVGVGAYGVVSLVGSPAKASAAAGCDAKAKTDAASAKTAAVHLPTAAQITLNVYNSTDRHGLAASTANVLKQRGFTIGKVTNDPLKANLAVAAQIRGGASGSPAMRVVAAEVPGSQLQPDTRADGSVDLVLGTGFTALASPDQVSAALKAAAAAGVKAPGTCS
jgi:hypothetical protein